MADVDLTYPVVLLRQARMLIERDGSDQQWKTWFAEVIRWLDEFGA